MPDPELIQFKSEISDDVFEATLESAAHPEASFFQWVKGLPETLRAPGASFHNTKGPGLFTLIVGESLKTGGLVTREDGAVLCQITMVVPQGAIDKLKGVVHEDSGERSAAKGLGD